MPNLTLIGDGGGWVHMALFTRLDQLKLGRSNCWALLRFTVSSLFFLRLSVCLSVCLSVRSFIYPFIHFFQYSKHLFI